MTKSFKNEENHQKPPIYSKNSNNRAFGLKTAKMPKIDKNEQFHSKTLKIPKIGIFP